VNDNTDGRIDNELRSAGERWRSQRPAPETDIDTTLFADHRPRPRLATLASVMAVLAVAVVAILIVVSLPPSNHEVAMASPSPTPTAVLPLSPSPTPTTSPTPVPSASTLPTPMPTPTVTIRPTSPPARTPPPLRSPEPGVVAPWQESTDNGLGLVYEIDGVDYANGVYVAVGEAAVPTGWDARHGQWSWGSAAAIWYSSDGQQWQPASLPDWPQLDRVTGVTATDSGFAALGPTADIGYTTYVLTSADGRDWQVSSSFAGYATALTALGPHLLAYPIEIYGDQDAAWTYADGTWSRADLPRRVLAATAADGYMWAVVGDQRPPALWRSSDGLSWDKVAGISGPKDLAYAQLAVGPNGWVITGEQVTDGPGPIPEYGWYAWTSPDSLTWTAVDKPPEHVASVLADDQGIVAVGFDTGGCCAWEPDTAQGAIWTSADGSVWQRLPKKGWTGRLPYQVTRSGNTLVVLGTDWNLSTDYVGAGAEWTIDRAALTGP
jgi:hypothetical protein